MSENYEKYGSKGSSEFQRWENELQELSRKQKFNPEPEKDERTLQELKTKIRESLIGCIRSRSTAGKVFWISILIAALGFVVIGLSAGSNDTIAEFATVVLLGGILAAVAVQKGWKKSIDKNVDAIIDFDKQFFDGEIMFKWKNGMKL